MVAEVVDIVIRERGARIVKQRFDEIARSADRTARSVFILRRALFTLGGFGFAAGLKNILDTFTNMQNRLKLVTTGSKDLADVTNELFNIANRTRTSFEGTATIYSRTALSAKNLGKTQGELLQFTERLNKAILLSGVGAQEANAALIQLSQGIAANRLGGDELRSVLEQTPYVADVIGKFLGVGRDQIRQLGKEGKITAQIILDAFAAAGTEIDTKFALLKPTIGQAFIVLRNNVIQTVGEIDALIGGSTALANVMITLAKSIGTVTKVTIAAGVAFASLKLANLISQNLAYSKSVQDGTFIILNSRRAEELRAASLARTAAAEVASTRAAIARNVSNKARLPALAAAAALDVKRAQNFLKLEEGYTAATGKIRNLRLAEERLAIAQAKVNTVGEINRTLTAKQIALRGTLTAQTNVLAVAEGRSAAATAASNSFLGRMERRFPIIASGILSVRAAFIALTAVIIANPFGAAITAITALITLLFLYRRQIKLTQDGVVDLGDGVRAAFQLMGEAVAPVTDFISESFDAAFGKIRENANSLAVFIGKSIGDAAKDFKTIGNEIIGVFVFAFGVVKDLYTDVGNASANTDQKILNGIIDLTQGIIDHFAKAFNFLVQLGLNLVLEFINIGRRLAYALADPVINAIASIADGFRGLVGGKGALLAETLGFDIPTGDEIRKNLEGVKKETVAVGSIISKTLQQSINDPFVKGPDLSGFKKDVADDATDLGDIIRDNYDKAFNKTDFIGGALDAVIERARQLAADRLKNDPSNEVIIPPGEDSGGKSGKDKKSKDQKTFKELLDELLLENELLKENTRRRDILRGILSFEDQLKRKLTETERAAVAETIIHNQLLEDQARAFEDIKGPAEDIAFQVAALNSLYAEGRITQNEYTKGIQEQTFAWLEYKESIGDASFSDGFLLGLEEMAFGVTDFTSEAGRLFGDFVGNLSEGFSSAFVDILRGTKSVKEALYEVATSALNTLLQALVKLGVQYALNAALGQSLAAAATAAQAAQAAAIAAVYAPAAAAVSLATSGANAGPAQIGMSGTAALAKVLFSSTPGFREGGSMMVGGKGGPDSQLLAFRATPNERVDILTPRQQQKRDGDNKPTILKEGDVKIINVLDPTLVGNYLATEEGERILINTLNRAGVI